MWSERNGFATGDVAVTQFAPAQRSEQAVRLSQILKQPGALDVRIGLERFSGIRRKVASIHCVDSATAAIRQATPVGDAK